MVWRTKLTFTFTCFLMPKGGGGGGGRGMGHCSLRKPNQAVHPRQKYRVPLIPLNKETYHCCEKIVNPKDSWVRKLENRFVSETKRL